LDGGVSEANSKGPRRRRCGAEGGGPAAALANERGVFFKKRKGKFVWTLEQGNVGLRVALALMFLGPRRLTRRGGVRAG
jgi:hypothetical protein